MISRKHMKEMREKIEPEKTYTVDGQLFRDLIDEIWRLEDKVGMLQCSIQHMQERDNLDSAKYEAREQIDEAIKILSPILEGYKNE